MRHGCWLIGLSLALVACADQVGDDDLDDEAWLDGKGDGASGSNIAATHLDVDLAGMRAVATIELERNGNVALEIGDLEIQDVTDDRGHRKFRIVDGKLLVSRVRGPLVVGYAFRQHDNADGLLPGGSTVTWPYFCGNVFPCHAQPADGTRFSLALSGVAGDKTALYPAEIAADAPPYQLAWAVGAYAKLELGETTAGTKVAAYYLPRGKTAATTGTRHLRAVFDWYEQTLGAYSFGREVASVSVVWGEGLFGGMEHHPMWHVAVDAMSDEVTHAHEAAHGWFGDGVRIRCWEDFVLSEGTTSYLAARALSVVAGREADVWAEYRAELDAAIAEGGAPAWPRGCNQIDILEDKLFTNLPYMQGAFFYRDVAAVVGVDVLDAVIGRFYVAHRNRAAGMQDMIDAIKADTGFDPTPIAEARLRRKF
ncbi:MAG: peptidase M1 [Deltaproteobacteria bacterium]|nr:peptidase M1 [Deltaproteobacteria bacterium]